MKLVFMFLIILKIMKISKKIMKIEEKNIGLK
jgi:hypothetical protein